MKMHRLAIVSVLALALAACGSKEEEQVAAGDEAATPAASTEAAATPAADEPVTAAIAEADAPPAAAEADKPAEPGAPAPAAKAEPAKPATPPPAFAMCTSCHSVQPGKNGIGPTLAGIVGSKAGDVPGYAFSDALKKSGVVWTEANLDKWLQGPPKMVPGTKMVMAVPNAEARKAVVDYLKTL